MRKVRPFSRALFVCVATFFLWQEAHAFDDRDLDKLLKSNGQHIIYIWSPYMPNSVTGLDTIKDVARELDLSVTIVSDPRATDEDIVAHAGQAWPRLTATRLIARGALVHMPAVAIVADGQLKQHIVRGLKSKARYKQLLRAALTGPDARQLTRTRQMTKVQVAPVERRRSQVVERTPLPDTIDYWFRPIPGTSKFAVNFKSDGSEDVSIFDKTTGEVQKAPQGIDPMPTPDGRFIMITYPGFRFYQSNTLDSITEDPVFSDATMEGGYGTAGIIKQNRASTTYRLIVEGDVGMAVRDYRVKANGRGELKFKALGKKQELCADYDYYDMPMISKDGQMWASVDSADSTIIMQIDRRSKTCPRLYTFAHAVGKPDFNWAGDQVVYAAVDDPSTSTAKIMLLDLRTQQVRQISDPNDQFVYFPAFASDTEVYYLVGAAKGGGTEIVKVQLER